MKKVIGVLLFAGVFGISSAAPVRAYDGVHPEGGVVTDFRGWALEVGLSVGLALRDPNLFFEAGFDKGDYTKYTDDFGANAISKTYMFSKYISAGTYWSPRDDFNLRFGAGVFSYHDRKTVLADDSVAEKNNTMPALFIEPRLISKCTNSISLFLGLKFIIPLESAEDLPVGVVSSRLLFGIQF